MQKIGSHPYLRKNVQEREHFSAIITFSGTQMTRAHWMEDNHCGVWPEELGGHWPLGTGLCGPAEAMLCYKASQDEKLSGLKATSPVPVHRASIRKGHWGSLKKLI